MSEKYDGKIVSVRDDYTVVINKGMEHEVKVGQKYLIIGLGEIIIDPDTKEELEQLEIVRGRVAITHVQQKIATAESCEYDKSADIKEIKKVSSKGAIAILGGLQDTVTESITPGKEYLKTLDDTKVGDQIIKL